MGAGFRPRARRKLPTLFEDAPQAGAVVGAAQDDDLVARREDERGAPLLGMAAAQDEAHPRVVAEREVAQGLAVRARAAGDDEALDAARLLAQADRQVPRLLLDEPHRRAEPRG